MGAPEGARVAVNWVPPSILPHLVPWLALLALLALKPNRAAAAWWIWLPVLFSTLGLEYLLRASASFIPSQGLEMLIEGLKALSFGLAAVWLLSGYLAWKHRFLTFLAVLGISLGFGEATYLLSQVVSGGGLEAMLGAVMIAFCTLIISTGLALAGLICRKRYGASRVLAWCVVMVVAMTTLAVTPFFVFAVVANPGQTPIKEFFQSLGLLAGINAGALAVYLLFSFACRFYRDRLKGLLHLGAPELPPMIAPPPEPVLEMTEAK
ncbi:MAG TPA: hypothetical protein VJA21_12585 [Verrucomicrobiae bacterium]